MSPRDEISSSAPAAEEAYSPAPDSAPSSWDLAAEGSPGRYDLPPHSAVSEIPRRAPPPILTRYRGLREIGRGSNEVVYEAWDIERSRRVALKVLHPHRVTQVPELKREFRIAAQVSHPNLVTLYELATEDGVWFFTMEFVEGTGFARHVRPDGELHEERLRAALAKLVLGLAALHRHGILHQDLKPSNIVVSPTGRVVLVDFGLAAPQGLEQDAWGRHVAYWGTPPYLAPERARGEPVSPASDWFSVGAVLYHALTGDVPPRCSHEGDVHAAEVDTDRLRFDDSCPRDLIALCRAFLRNDPDERAGETEAYCVLGVDPGLEEVLSVRSRPACFIGRQPELAQLGRALRMALRRRTVIAHVRGESGMGKTALVQHFLRALDPRSGAFVAVGSCYERESVPYKGFDDLVDDLARQLRKLDETTLEKLVPPDTHLLVRLFPVMQRVPAFTSTAKAAEPDIDPHVLRRRAFRALKELLCRLAEWRPTILAIDDAQWADVESAYLLNELTSAPQAPPALFILAYRREEEQHSGFLRELSRQYDDVRASRVVPIDLEPLSEDEAIELVRALSPSNADVDATVIAHESAGNPFLIEVMARHATLAPDHAVEPSLERVIRDEHGRLSDDARRLVEVLAVAGRPVAQEVAMKAADIAGDPLSVLAELQTRHLVKQSAGSQPTDLALYHDALRPSLLAQLDETGLALRHRALAGALAASSGSDPEALARHHFRAGDRETAARHALTAAEQAADSLAFLRAAELFAFARTCGVRDDWRLACRQAEALALAGRSTDAGALFQACAQHASPSRAIDLNRRAAEQYLVSGRIDRGVATLMPVLRALDLSYAPTAWHAMASIGKNLAILGVRGTQFQPRPDSARTERMQDKLLTCFSAGRGLVSYDPVRGSDFITQGTLLALQEGDAPHVARGLSYVGLMYLYQGSARSIRRGFALIDEAERVARHEGHFPALGWVGTVRGLASISIGAWRAGLEEIDEAVALMRDRTVGTRWEQAVGLTTSLLALAAMGDIDTLRTRAQNLRREGDELGDLFSSVESSLYLAYTDIVAGKLDVARARIREAMDRWSQADFHFQHWIALRHRTYCDLYEGSSWTTLESLRAGCAAAKTAHLLENQIVRGEAALLEGLVALSLHRQHRSDALVQTATQAAQRLAKEGRDWATASGLILEAGLAADRGERDEAVSLLRRARELYLRADMSLHAAATKLRLGQLVADAGGEQLVTDAAEQMRVRGASEPEALADVLAPRVTR